MNMFVNAIALLETPDKVLAAFDEIMDKQEDFPGAMAFQRDGGLLLFLDPEADPKQDIARLLSKSLDTASVHFQSSDGVSWRYQFFSKGELRDEFSTAVDDDVLENLALLCETLDVAICDIENYIHPIDDDFAYKTDQFSYDDPWQITDFMRALGYHYPDADEDAPLGDWETI
ncbi:MAG: hypothetical protein HRT89_07875 [Lentisphaeria bacterium]|nr:hypothetical protein [Lentisphaeria bacterium]